MALPIASSQAGGRMVLYTDGQDCCGCAACATICPKQAITMRPDADGFVYPVVEDALCVECELCVNTCAFQKVSVTAGKPLAVYAAVNKDQATLYNSSSGGVFAALASLTFEKGGVVFGCAFNKDMEPEHICIDSPANLGKLQGSKYVQSDVKDTYAEAKQYLQGGRPVLYTGTPCQIAGLKSYLGKDWDNLVTADLVCHGVPSAAFFKGYIDWLEEYLGSKVTAYQFRDKSKIGWGFVGNVTFLRNGRTRSSTVHPAFHYYYQYFLQGDIYRESCYHCKYAGGNRQGDFTIGDYWGVEKAHPKVDVRHGVSLLLVNTQKGMTLMEQLSQGLDLTESTFDQARAQNGQLNEPTARSGKREAILRTWREGGYQTVADEYYKTNRKQIVMSRIKMLVPRPLKRMAKKLLGRT